MIDMGLASHTPIRARRVDGHMKFRTVTGPILSDAMPSAAIPSLRQDQALTTSEGV